MDILLVQSPPNDNNVILYNFHLKKITYACSFKHTALVLKELEDSDYLFLKFCIQYRVNNEISY